MIYILVSLLIHLSLRLPSRFIADELGLPWFYYLIYGISFIIIHVIISFLGKQDNIKATKIIFIGFYSVVMAVCLKDVCSSVFQIISVLTPILPYIFNYKVMLGIGTLPEITTDAFFSDRAHSPKVSTATESNSSGSQSSTSNYIPKVLHPKLPDSQPERPKFPIAETLHPKLGNRSIERHSSLIINGSNSVSSVSQLASSNLFSPLDLTSFPDFAANLEARCIAIAESKPPMPGGGKSVTLGDLGILRGTPE